MYDVDDRGTVLRVWYFLDAVPPTPDQFRSFAIRNQSKNKGIAGDPVLARWATGVSTWATEALGRARAAAPRVNRGRWQYIAGLDLATDGKEVRIERTSGSIGHFTVFADPRVLCESVKIWRQL